MGPESQRGMDGGSQHSNPGQLHSSACTCVFPLAEPAGYGALSLVLKHYKWRPLCCTDQGVGRRLYCSASGMS